MKLLGSYLEATFVKQFNSLLRKREKTLKRFHFWLFFPMGFPESLPTSLFLILHDHYASKLDKPCLLEHWRQPNAYSTHSFLHFHLSHPQTGWLDQFSLKHTPLSDFGLVHCSICSRPSTTSSAWMLHLMAWRETHPSERSLHMVHQWRRAGCCLRGRSTEMASHQSPSERGMAGEEVSGEPREEASSQAAVYTGCRM